MSDILNRSFVDLLPANLQDDPKSIAVGKAFDAVFREQYSKLVTGPLIYANIDNLPHSTLDVLAPDLHVDIYNTSWSLEKKREVCKSSAEWHLYKGTPYVLEDIAKSLVGSVNIKEWKEYNGLSFHFKLLFNVMNSSFDEAKVSELESISTKYKNLRSKIDDIEFTAASKKELKILALNTIQEIVFIPDKNNAMYWDSDASHWADDNNIENYGDWSY